MQTVRAYKEHITTLLHLSWPNILTSVLSIAIPLSSTLAVGHVGPSVLLGASALGGMFANATGFACGPGLSMALDTLCSQAYGAKKYKLTGLHTQRAMIILTLLSVPISLLWWYSGYLLRFISDGETAALSQLWVRILIPSMWPRFMSEAYRRYLLGQRVVWPITVSSVFVVPFHVIVTYLLTFQFGWGFTGAAWATTISTWLGFISLVFVGEARVIYLRRRGSAKFQMLEMVEAGSSQQSDTNSESSDDDEDNGDPLHTWPSWSMDVFRGWGQFLRLGWATSVSLMVELGSFEVNAVIASKLGEIPLSSHAILCYIAGIWYMPPSGIASAATSLVGNSIGAERPKDAAMYSKLAFTIAFLYAITNGALAQLYKYGIGRLFTSDEVVISVTSDLMLTVAIYSVFDALKCIGVGILRGSGRPSLTVFGNMFSCFFIGYPVALLLVFKANLGLKGLWLGMATAWFTVSVVCIVIMSRTNWEVEVQHARKRNADAEMLMTPRNKRSLVRATFDEKENLMSTANSEAPILPATFIISQDAEDPPNDEVQVAVTA